MATPQLELDLLADARDVLERWCTSRSRRHIYPEGPNVAVVLEAWQELDRLRVLGRVRERPKSLRRVLRRLVRTMAQRDALARSRRLRWRYPPPRIRSPHVRPQLVQRALARVDPDARRLVRARLDGDWIVPDPGSSLAGEAVREQRGLDQFREAIVNEALGHPRQLAALHPQYLLFAASPPPLVRRYPLASFLLVKLPLRLMSTMVTLLFAAYVGAFMFLNDERLAEIVSDGVSGLVEGDLRMDKIHWELPLIVDLLTGQPTHVVVEGISIWEASASYGGVPKRRTAWARRIEADIVLHEIIPWNRIGVPQAIEIPWLLHLTDARSTGDAWFVVREYDDTDDSGQDHTLISLIDAFRALDADPDLRGISFRVDRAHFGRATLDVDFLHGLDGWEVATELRDLTLELRFDAPGPREGLGLELPLRFDVSGRATQGYFALDDIEIPLADFALTQLASGTDNVPLGDVRFSGEGLAAGSPLRLDGNLADAFSREPAATEPLPLDAIVVYGDAAQVQLTAGSSDPRLLAGHLERQLGLASGTLVANDAKLWANVDGPLDEPRYHIAAEGLTLDLLGEPAWVLDDVQVSVDIEQGPLPDRWRDRKPGDTRRLIARFDTFEGRALAGDFILDPGAQEPAHVVFPEGDEPYLIAVPLTLEGFDPGLLVPDDAKLAATLGGHASGRVDLHRMVLGPKPVSPAAGAPAEGAPAEGAPTQAEPAEDMSLLLAELRLDDVRVVRNLGPAADGIPRRVRANGTILIDADGAIDADGLLIETDGTALEVSGGIDGKLATLSSTQLRLDIHDGNAFARAFDLPAYFDTLRASLGVYGSTSAPSGRDGKLWLAGVGVQGGTPTDATMSLDRGVLHVHAPRAHLFGGTGSIDADITLFERGGLSSDPRLRATVELREVELADLVGSGLSGKANLRLSVGDAEGKALPLSKLQLRGQATVPDLRMGGTRYRDASVKLSLGPEQVLIEELVLPVHRAVSPFHSPDVSVPIGKIVASGSVGLDDDTELDLKVTAEGVPLRLVARLLEADVPVHGQIGAGTELRVSGALRRPSVAGVVRLAGLSAEGIALGSGLLEVTSTDVEAEAGLSAHRELRVTGELSNPNSATGGIQWTVDGLIALGEVPRARRRSDDGVPPFDAEVAINLDRISLDTLMRGLDRGSGKSPTLFGRLNRVGAVVVTCDPHASMISACRGSDREEQSLEISLAMEDAWIGGHDPTTANPCQDPTVLCAKPLRASVDWPRIVLEEPWNWQTSGKSPARVTLSGSFDLSSPAAGARTRAALGTCDVPAPRAVVKGASRVAIGDALARLEGTIDMAVIADLLGSEVLRAAHGRLKVDLGLTGPAALTQISGNVQLPRAAAGQPAEHLTLDVAGLATPVEVSVEALDLRVDDQWLTAAGELRVLGETLRFGSVGPPGGQDHTGLAIGGACAGRWGMAVDGTVGARIINQLAGEGTATKGGVEIQRISAGGSIDDESPLEFAQGSIAFGRTSLTLQLDDGLPGVELTAGQLDFALCSEGVCPPEVGSGMLALYLGGRQSAAGEQRPANALRAKVGPRGDAFAWGIAYLDLDFTGVQETRVFLELEDVPYRGYDQRGRPVFEAELSSRPVTLQGGNPLVVAGLITIDRARYVQDAVQGVEILAFTDDVELPSAPPPELVRDLQFDLRVQTSAPLRVENNIARGVEADAVIEVTGTYDDPDFTGRVEVEAGGTVDIPFLTGTYEIQRGRITMMHDLADSEVDVLAMRRELVYIDDQSRQVYLLLGGTAEAITWKCIADGDTSGAVETQRGCLDYLVLGAGDVPASALTVQRTGGGGLANARKPLQVVGHVTEFDFGRRIEDAVPRFGPYVPDIRLRLGQIGPELEVTTPQEWLDFDYAHGTLGLDYTRGYPGFLLQQSREVTFELRAVDRLVFEVSRDIRSYLNNRIIFDPLRQTTVEFRVDFEIPSLR